MEEIKRILNNSKLTSSKIKANLIHPVLETVDYKPRDVFSDIKEISKSFFTTKDDVRMVGLAGLRGTGKTTLLWQAAEYIYNSYSQNIYFFHISDLKHYDIGVREIHKGFEEYFANGKLWEYNEKVVFLFDEIHEDANWADSLKILYDLFRNVFVIATGSSALLLQSTADLVSRMFIQHIFPLSFTEYISIKQNDKEDLSEIQSKLQEILLHSKTYEELKKDIIPLENTISNYYSKITNVENTISDYILYHNITRFSLQKNKARINSQISDLVKRVIYEDIPKISQRKYNELISEKILRRLAASDEINIQSLSQAIGISQNEINETLDILVKAELLNILYPFGGIDSKINKAHKYFFMSPSIRKVILNPLIGETIEPDLYAKLLEDIVVLYLKRIFKQESIVSFATFKSNKNPDLLIETIDKPIIVEVGINKKTIWQITKSKIDYKYGIIINSKIDKIEFQDNIIIVPLRYILIL
jgi:uncharacterized protein